MVTLEFKATPFKLSSKDSLHSGFNIILTESFLLANETTRLRTEPIWMVPADAALAKTDLQHDLLPLPYLAQGMNLVPKIQGLNQEQLRQMRLLIGDRDEPYYYSNRDLLDFYRTEGQDMEQAAALACESWAGELSYDEGNYSAGGISVSAAATASDKRQRANELRLRFGKG